MTDLALRAHHLEKGANPESLAAIVPEYLPEVPDDGYLLYSVGRDGVDDGGKLLDAEKYFNREPGNASLETFYYDEADKNATDDENSTAVDSNTTSSESEDENPHPGDA